MLEERRRSPRHRAYLPVRVRQQGGPQVIETLTRDLSEGGLRCLSQLITPVGSELSLELMLSTGSEPLTLHGRSAWFRTLPDSEQFDLGIAFIDLSPQDQRRLATYLHLLSSQTVALGV